MIQFKRKQIFVKLDVNFSWLKFQLSYYALFIKYCIIYIECLPDEKFV